MKIRSQAIGTIALLLMSAATALAATNYSFSGVAADGRSVSLQFTTTSPLTGSVTLPGTQVTCSPACDDIGIFPNSSLRYDQLVIDLHNTSGGPTGLAFYLPFGAFSSPGSYKTIAQSGSFNTGTLTVQTTGAPNITTASPLAAGATGVAYSQTISATGGTAPYSYAVVDPANLPPGLTLSTAGVLSGAPTTAGSYTFQVRVTDAAAQSSTQSFTVVVNTGVTVTTVSLPGAVVGAAYTHTLSASGGTPGYTWSLASGSLPGGISLGPTGLISGVPSAGGNFAFTVRVTDSTSASSTRDLTMTVASTVTITTSSLNYAAVGAAFSQTLGAIGGQAPYTWTIFGGNLQPGLGLSSAGVISGTPTSAGNWTVSIRVTDAVGNVAVQTYSAVSVNGLTISSPATLPAGQTGSAYNYQLTAAGGVAPYSWIVASGNLQAGLTLSTSGILSGTPTASGTANLFVRVTDNAGIQAFQAVAITVTAPLSITTGATLPTGTTSAAYSQTLAATGGTAPYTWNVTAGAVPPGLTLSTAGVLSGTPTTNGNYNFVVRLTDNLGGAVLQSFNLTVGNGLSITTSPTLPTGTVGTVYSQTFAASGGTPTYFWTLASGSVPPGLSFSLNGVLSGTPTTAGTYNMTVRVTDSLSQSATLPVTVTIVPVGGSTLTITTSSLPSATAGTPYSFAMAATGGTAPYGWVITSGALPSGLTMSSSGVISGTTSAAGSYPVTIRVNDSASGSAQQAFTLTVSAVLTITTSTLPNGMVGSAYSQTLAAAGGVAPLTWTVVAGNLPSGLNLSTTGVLSGTPTLLGSFSFVVKVTDAGLNSTQQFFTLSVTTGLTITTTTLPTAAVGSLYAQTLAVTGGTAPYYWSFYSGTLPPGLSVTLAGQITGTPTAAGTYVFGVRVTDSTALTATQTYTLVVGSGMSITTTTLANGNVGSPYSQTLAVSGGTSPYFWSMVSGSLPTGLSIATNGVISGTPTTAGSYTMVVRVTDATSQSAQQQLTITIGSGMSITTSTTLPGASTSVAYSQTFGVSGGTSPYLWSLTAGTLPPGLALANNGILSGVPSTAGTYSFTIRVTDAATATATQTFTLTVSAALSIITASPLPSSGVGLGYFQVLSATGGTQPYSWTVSSGSLPPGLAMTTSGLISGTATLGGEFTFTVRVTDASQATGTQVFKLVITATVTITSAATMPDGAIGQLYNQTLAATGGVAPYTWTLYAGTLPPGLNLGSLGQVSGTPTTAGTYPFTVRVSDTAGIATTQVMSLTVGSGTGFTRAGVMSHIASGGNWKTTVVITNPNGSSSTVRLNVYDDSGTALTLPFSVTQGVNTTAATNMNTLDVVLPAYTSIQFDTEAPGTTVYTGWIDVRSSVPVYGYAIFRQKGDARPDSEGTSPLENRLPSTVVLPFDNVNLFTMGVALVNPNASASTTVLAIARDDSGNEVSRDTLQLPANGHTAYALVTRMAATNGKRGTVEFQNTAAGSLAVLGLRFSPSLSFTSVPAIIRQ